MKKTQGEKCITCEGNKSVLLSSDEIAKLLTELSGWVISKNKKTIEKELIFKNFDKAMDFVNIVADMAELENHHPDIEIRYNKVDLSLTTHLIGGLSKSDFIMASKIDGIIL